MHHNNQHQHHLHYHLISHLPLAKSDMMTRELVKVRMGRRAKGSCSDMSTLSRSFKVVMSSMPEKMAMKMVGKMAMVRVSSTRCHRFQVRFRKPWETQVWSILVK